MPDGRQRCHGSASYVPHAEFVAVGLADDRRARGGQQAYDGRVEG